jgi:D-arabinose 1-dehydrogenase-like Zn-dependent alcohol dehydrogenase
LITEYEELREQVRETQFELTVAADKLYVVGSRKAGSAAIDLIEALGAVTAASINEGDDELQRAMMAHHIAVSNFNSVARENVGTAPAGHGPVLSTRLLVGGIVTIAASVVLAVLLVVSLLRWKRSAGS